MLGCPDSMQRCAVVACLLAAVVSAGLPQQERAALVDLFEATSGPLWLYNPGWAQHASGADPCAAKWFGVVCDAQQSTVR